MKKLGSMAFYKLPGDMRETIAHDLIERIIENFYNILNISF